MIDEFKNARVHLYNNTLSILFVAVSLHLQFYLVQWMVGDVEFQRMELVPGSRFREG
jgi:hypothetical protein